MKLRKSALLTLSLAVIFALLLDNAAYSASLIGRCKDGSSNCVPKKNLFFKYKGKKPKTTYKLGIFQGGADSIGDIAGARQLVQNAFSRWANVPGSKFKLTLSSSALQFDNLNDVLNTFNKTKSGSVAIIDNSGDAINSIFGQGGENTVLGLGGPLFVIPSSKKINNSRLIVNGNFFTTANNPGSSLQTIKNGADLTITHEVGHSFGIDHTQNFDGNFKTGEEGSNPGNVSVMFPTLFSFLNQSPSLKEDDKAAVSDAYKNKTAFKAGYGKIVGKIQNAGKAVTGFVVTAYDINDPTNKTVSVPSDTKGKGTGSFSIPFPVNGSTQVILRFQPIGSTFTGASSVGIYSPNTSLQGGYFAGSGSPFLAASTLVTSAVNQISESGLITVTAGKKTKVGTLDLSSLN